jgi:hypothetical protein
MKSKWLLGLVLLSSSCFPLPANEQSRGIQNPSPALPSPTAETVSNAANKPLDDSKNKNVPPEFKGIDFRNFTYQTKWRNRRVRLTNGEYVHPEGAGGDTYTFDSVDFANLHDGGKAIAVVRLLLVSCGVSCDGGSHLFYFYRIRQRKPLLFWRIETGSLAYECGLKSFDLSQRKLTLEVFRTCQSKGSSIQLSNDPDAGEDESGGKYLAHSFTRFVFEFNNGRFIKRRRQILPNPNPDTGNYEQQISIRD